MCVFSAMAQPWPWICFRHRPWPIGHGTVATRDEAVATRDELNIIAAGAVDREFFYIFLYLFLIFWIFWSDTGLKLLIRGRASFSQSMNP